MYTADMIRKKQKEIYIYRHNLAALLVSSICAFFFPRFLCMVIEFSLELDTNHKSFIYLIKLGWA
jgi:hypothetical protein